MQVAANENFRSLIADILSVMSYRITILSPCV